MVEKTKERAINKDKIDFCINSSEFTDITLTNEESENLIRLMERGPNEKAKVFSEEALRYYNDMLLKNKEYNKNK